MNDDGEKPWTRRLLVGLGALLAVALMIGGVVGAFALGMANVSGIGDSGPATSTSPSLVVPSRTPTRKPSSIAPSEDVGTGGAPSASREPGTGSAITLRARPVSVRPDQRINLTGTYPRGNGATLQVQRFEDGWADFPATFAVDGGRFDSYIRSSRTGDLRFRVVDPAAGRVSNEVRVTIR